MARILIAEPHADTSALLAFVVRRLGHEPVLYDGSPEQAAGADALVLEPGDGGALALAARLRERWPELPIVCTSIFPRWAEADAIRPDAYLVKPFPLLELQRVLARALDRRRGDAVPA